MSDIRDLRLSSRRRLGLSLGEVPDIAAMIAAAARLLKAWEAATLGVEPFSLTNPALAEVYEAMEDLMRATETSDLVSAYKVLDDVVAEMKLFKT